LAETGAHGEELGQLLEGAVGDGMEESARGGQPLRHHLGVEDSRDIADPSVAQAQCCVAGPEILAPLRSGSLPVVERTGDPGLETRNGVTPEVVGGIERRLDPPVRLTQESRPARTEEERVRILIEPALEEALLTLVHVPGETPVPGSRSRGADVRELTLGFRVAMKVRPEVAGPEPRQLMNVRLADLAGVPLRRGPQRPRERPRLGDAEIAVRIL